MANTRISEEVAIQTLRLGPKKIIMGLGLSALCTIMRAWGKVWGKFTVQLLAVRFGL